MKPLDQYKISYPYGATDPPYSPGHAHRGDDRAAPTGTPVIVEGVQIGLVGSTGLSTGPHTHCQEWQGNVSNTRKPQNWFKGGKVTQATQSSDFGNYVTIQTDDGWNDTYAHLSRIDVKVGQLIGGSMPASQTPVDPTTVQLEYNNGLLRDANTGEVNGWVQGGQNVESLQRTIQASGEHNQIIVDQQLGVKARQLLGSDTTPQNMESKMQAKYGSGEFVETKVYVKK